MDIFNSKPRPIKCVRNDAHGMMIYSENHHLLEIGKTYHLEDMDVNTWFTGVYLKEFPNVPFNSVMFEEVANG